MQTQNSLGPFKVDMPFGPVYSQNIPEGRVKTQQFNSRKSSQKVSGSTPGFSKGSTPISIKHFKPFGE